MKTFEEFKAEYEPTRKSFLCDVWVQHRLLGRKVEFDPDEEFDNILVSAYTDYLDEMRECDD